MAGRLYQRTGKLIVGDTVIPFGPSDSLRVTFNVSKAIIAPDPNTAEVTVDNLNAKTRSKLDQVYKSSTGRVPVGIEAGYEGQHGMIFKGESTSIYKARTVTGNLTTITAVSGRAIARRRLNKAFGRDTELGSIFESLLQDTIAGTVESAKEALTAIKGGKIAAAGKALVRGFVASGDPMRVWDQISKTYDFDTFVDDENLVIVERGSTRAQPAVVLRADTGMIGVPEPQGDDSRPGGLVVSVTSLLNARILIGGRVRVMSETISGDFRCETVDHAGDTHGEAWTTTVTGLQVRPR